MECALCRWVQDVGKVFEEDDLAFRLKRGGSLCVKDGAAVGGACKELVEFLGEAFVFHSVIIWF